MSFGGAYDTIGRYKDGGFKDMDGRYKGAGCYHGWLLCEWSRMVV